MQVSPPPSYHDIPGTVPAHQVKLLFTELHLKLGLKTFEHFLQIHLETLTDQFKKNIFLIIHDGPIINLCRVSREVLHPLMKRLLTQMVSGDIKLCDIKTCDTQFK